MIINFIKVLNAEIVKQHRNNIHNSYIILFSMLLWPIISLLTVYYSYKPFENTHSNIPLFNSSSFNNQVFIFILLGYVGLMFFRCFLQTAWFFSRERFMGTLEIIFLSPANRLAIVLGNAIVSLSESIWLFTIFCIFSFLFKKMNFEINYITAFITVIISSISALCWGVFVNSFFLITRDARTLSTVLYEPLELFSGARVPPISLPQWGKVIGAFFPTTWCIDIIRKTFLEQATLVSLKTEIITLVIISIILILLTNIILKRGERRAKETGNMILF